MNMLNVFTHWVYACVTRYILNFIICCICISAQTRILKSFYIFDQTCQHGTLARDICWQLPKDGNVFVPHLAEHCSHFSFQAWNQRKTSCLTISHQHKSKFMSSRAFLSVGKNKLCCEHFILKENQCDQFRDKILSSCPIHTYLKSKKKAAFTWCNPRIGHVIFTKEKNQTFKNM